MSTNSTTHRERRIAKCVELSPIRMTVRDAAAYIGVSTSMIEAMLGMDVLTCDRDSDAGERLPDGRVIRGGTRYLLTDELDYWVSMAGCTRRQREIGMRAYRRSKGRKLLTRG
jgi:hypothetical protein